MASKSAFSPSAQGTDQGIVGAGRDHAQGIVRQAFAVAVDAGRIACLVAIIGMRERLFQLVRLGGLNANLIGLDGAFLLGVGSDFGVSIADTQAQECAGNQRGTETVY